MGTAKDTARAAAKIALLIASIVAPATFLVLFFDKAFHNGWLRKNL